MIRYDRRVWPLAAALSALAGFVDALGFLALGGYFVSFMSGNSTRLAVGVAQQVTGAWVAGGLIAGFVLGVVAGSLVAHRAGAHRRAAVLGLVAALLALAAGFGVLGVTPLTVAAMTLAMGAENTVFEREGEVSIGLTYMTGTLVKLGQRLTAALLGGDRFAWVPYLVLWLGLVAGAVGGAALYARLGLGALWAASGAALTLAGVAVLIGEGRPTP